jgi:hypothetical protein
MHAFWNALERAGEAYPAARPRDGAM